MATNIILSILIISEVLIGSYYLGRYISSVNEIFDNNTYASWTLGLITNLFITFLGFFVFSWIAPPIIYYIILYFLKEFILFVFIFLQREKINGKTDIKNIAMIILAGIVITFIYNYGIVKYTHDQIKTSGLKFASWFKFKSIFSDISSLSIEIVNKWIISIVVGSICFATVASFLKEISKGNSKHVPYLALLLTLGIFLLMGTGLRLEDSFGYFLLLFMLQTSMRLIIYSRRRYAAQFGITSFVAWTIDTNIFIAATVLAFITTIIYTFLKKPRASLFWVQLVAPQVIIMSLQLNWISTAIVIPLFVLSTLAYIFMLSVKRLKFLKKLNDLVIKYRIMTPIIMLLILVSVAGVLIGTEDTNIKWMHMHTTSKLFYNNHNYNFVSSVIQMVIWSVILIYMTIRIVIAFKTKKNIYWKEFVMIFSVLLSLFLYNPLMEHMFDSTNALLASQVSRAGIIVVAPPMMVLSDEIFKKTKKYIQKVA